MCSPRRSSSRPQQVSVRLSSRTTVASSSHRPAKTTRTSTSTGNSSPSRRARAEGSEEAPRKTRRPARSPRTRGHGHRIQHGLSSNQRHIGDHTRTCLSPTAQRHSADQFTASETCSNSIDKAPKTTRSVAKYSTGYRPRAELGSVFQPPRDRQPTGRSMFCKSCGKFATEVWNFYRGRLF
jgi:hypothetical protein